MGILERLWRFLFSPKQAAAPTTPTPTPTPPSLADPLIDGPAAVPVAKRTKSASGLDSSSFLPITREEIIQAGKGRSLLASPWFGRRELIPSADDPRTRIIDRALVTHGFMTPEQLVEIHEVGVEMDRVRPTSVAIDHASALVGEEAVQALREERALAKARKKAEAAERKRIAAEAVAHRRATDIVFLGRGVSGGLSDRTGDPEKLATLSLPILHTPSEVAVALGLSIPKLRWLAFHSEAATRVHYVAFEVPKKSGGMRTLSAPHRTLAAAQRWILAEILSKVPIEEPAHGFVTGRSILSNARPHSRKAVVINVDLEGFFPSVGFPLVRRIFRNLGYSPAASTILGLICTECPRRKVEYDGTIYYVATGPRGLPQGACTSPALSNLSARRLDRRLSGFAAKLGLTYTRYADDITLSGNSDVADRVGYILACIRHVAEDSGFRINDKKTRVLKRNARQTVTGLVVNDRPGVRRDEVKRIRAILHRAKFEGLESQNREGRPNFSAWLQGKIAYISMARPEVGARLRADFEAL